MSDNDDKNNNTPSNDRNKEGYDPDRRRFVKNTGMVVGGLAGGSLLGGFFTNRYQTDTTKEKSKKSTKDELFSEARMFFTRYEDFAVLEQASERIFPEDDNGPGAIGLGVPYFIDKQLAGPWGMNGHDYRQGPFLGGADASYEQSRLSRGEIFVKGLRKMDSLSKERFDTSFDEAEEDEQIEILEDFEKGDVDLKVVSSSSFFSLLRMTILEGAYSDPLYGGNRGMEGWKMKEYPGAVASYANEIESEDFVKMEPISLTDYQQK